MTQKLYYDDSMLFCFKSEVVSCVKDEKTNLYAVELKETAFYPEGGGQPADKGLIDGINVVDVNEKDGIVLHYLEKEIAIGKQVEGKIDSEYRIQLMQQHTGEHIVSGIINKLYGFDNVGFHMGNDAVTLDFSGVLTQNNIDRVETLANEAIFKNAEIFVVYPTKEELATINYRSKKEIAGQVRIVSVGDYDICACCGTHLKTTGQVGIIKFISSQKYKNGTRIFMLTGKKALNDYKFKNDMILNISSITSAKPYEVQSAVERINKESEEMRKQITDLQNQLMKFKVSNIQKSDENLCMFEENMLPTQLRQFCTMLCEKAKIVITLSGNDENGYKYALGSLTEDVRELSKSLNVQLNGKGGGSKELVQGSFATTKEQIKNAF